MERTNRNWGLLMLGIAAYLIVFALFVASCNPAKQLSRIDYKHPDVTSAFCAQKYPIKITKDTVYQVGTSIQIDTFIHFDTVANIEYRYVNKYRIDTFIKKVTVLDSAAITSWRLSLQEANKRIAEWNDKYNKKVDEVLSGKKRGDRNALQRNVTWGAIVVLLAIWGLSKYFGGWFKSVINKAK